MTQELLGRVHRELIDVLNSINQDKIHHDGDYFHELLHDVEKALQEHAMRETQRLGQEIEQERHELQAKGEHPAPCARHCEANAFQIVIKNLKAQLAQPEHEPVAYFHPHKGFYWAKPTSISAPTIADVEPLPLYTTPPQRTEQEPVAKYMGMTYLYLYKDIPVGTLLYTPPPQRKPLTDEQIFACENSVPDEIVSDRDWCIYFARAIEAKLKENA